MVYCSLIVVITTFTACTEYFVDNNGTQEGIGLPGSVNVMNENLASAKSRTGANLLAPPIHTSKVSINNKTIYLRYTTTPGIHPKQTNNVSTRGTSITTNNFYDSYSLYTYLYPNNNTWATVASSINSTYSDEKVYKTMKWKTTEFWPGIGKNCCFFAYAPYHATGLSGFAISGWPTFHYSVPASATDQNDLLVTRNDTSTGIGDYGNIDVPGNFNMNDSVTFDHACTAIRFAIGKQMAPGTIKKIEIQNVYGEADYLYQTESWTNLKTLTTFSLTKDIPIKATDSNIILNNDDDIFMMIPQKVPVNATLAVTIDDGQEHVLKACIDNDTWLKGYTVTYYLSTADVNTDYVLSVSPASTSLNYSGGTDMLNINSYKQTYYGSQVAIPWTATYSYDENGIKGTNVYSSANSVVTAFTASSNGSISGENINFTVASASSSTTKPQYRSTVENSTHTKILREASDGSCDLANGKQTANCYVIHAPGHYSLPLVYGNALNGDKTYNTNSYNSSTFVDHQGKQITSPYIYETNGGANIPYDACIVWQDAPNLITPSSLKLSNDNHSMEFDIERSNICQGNSLIAIRDKDGNIMWSWHIWVTDYTLMKTYEVHNASDAINKFMEVPLGYCDPEIRVGNEFRRFNITVKQSDSEGETANISIPQITGNYTYNLNLPYYQYGRKDPILPSDGVNSDKPYYDNMYNPRQTLSSADIKDVILHPNMFNTSIGNGSLELWNKGNDLSIIKTIYDPSPSGYRVPSSNAYTGFSLSNVSGIFNHGWHFLCNPNNNNGDIIFFPTQGLRQGSGDAGYIYDNGYYWSVGTSSPSNAIYLNFTSGSLYPQYTYYRSYGFCLMPTLE